MKDDLKESLKHAISEASRPSKIKTKNKILSAVTIIFLIITVGLIYHFKTISEPVISNFGKIISLEHSSDNPRQIIVVGYTENLPPDRPYPVVTVDVEHLRLCWPKEPFIEPNSKFRLSFYEGGPAGECVVSLYALNQEYYQIVRDWFEKQRLGGMPLFPNRFKIDTKSVKI